MNRMLLPLAVILATACEDTTKPGSGHLSLVTDADGDGVFSDVDCDDADPTIFPGADELCDGQDNDCDTEVDEDPIDAATWYADTDGDTWGDPDSSMESCNGGPGWVADAGDCDDTAPAVHPDAPEVCDGIDNDCDSLIDGPDAVDAVLVYVDADGDGFGDPDSPVTTCDPSGYVADNTDCDDSDWSIYPGAPELWYDGVDSDCEGTEDPSICDDVPGGAVVAIDPTCTYTPAPPSAWSIDVEWNTDPEDGWVWAEGPDYAQVMMTPVVGQLTDDNGDGVIDERDTPDVVFNTFKDGAYRYNGYLRVVSGDGSTVHFSVSEVTDGVDTWKIAASAGIAVGDLEGDGYPDIVTLSQTGEVIALESDGTLKWVGPDVGRQYGYPTISDMDADGVAEVVAGAHILDASGAVLAVAPSSSYTNELSFAADLDGDGMQEHIGGNAVTAVDGSILWQDTSVTSGYPAVMDWNGDGFGDVLSQVNGHLTVFDTTGTLLLSQFVSSDANGAPCVGDLDGDGQPEVVISGVHEVTAIENDGSVMWTMPSFDTSSRGTPCTTWDFNGDGRFEVLLADQTDFRIYDGSTGTVLLEDTEHSSATLREQPIPVDIDRDGNTEVVLATNGYSGYGSRTGIYVLGEANDEWTTTRTTWNQGAFWSGNIDDDMAVPSPAAMPWDLDNSFRTQRSPTIEPLATQDFRVEILGICADSSSTDVEVWIAAENVGAIWGPAAIDVALYRDDAGVLTLLDVQPTPSNIDPGERLAPMTFTIDASDFGSNGIVAVVDDDGTGSGIHNECNESNNADTWN